MQKGDIVTSTDPRDGTSAHYWIVLDAGIAHVSGTCALIAPVPPRMAWNDPGNAVFRLESRLRLVEREQHRVRTADGQCACCSRTDDGEESHSGDWLDVVENDDEAVEDGPLALSEGLSISFAGEAYETFQTLLQRCEGFGVTLTTLDGERIAGVLAGPQLDDEWGDAVGIYPVEDGQDYMTLDYYRRTGATKRVVRVGDVHVH